MTCRDRQRICFVALRAYPMLVGDDETPVIGGAELQQVIVAKGLARRGYRVSMICWNFGQPDGVDVDGVTVIRACGPSEGVRVLRFVWPRLTSIWSALRRADADVYYQRTAGMITGVVAAFCRMHDRKSIFAAAGDPDLQPNTPRVPNIRDRYMYEYGLKHADRILVQNEQQVRLCRQVIGREPFLVPNCHLPKSVSSSASLDYVLWVSMIRGVKRPHLFLDLAQALPNIRFRMIGGPGEGDDALYRAVGARAAKLSNVEFLGFVPYSKVEEHFDHAIAFVNTSESEGFPNTFLHAWARGVPTVSFVDCGARQDDQVVGRIVASPSALIQEVEILARDPGTRERESRRCKKYCDLNHSPDGVLDLYERVIQELLRR